MFRFLVAERVFIFVALLIWTSFGAGCGTPPSEFPLARIHRTLEGVPTYSIILEDMKRSGNFIPTYAHRYRVVEAEKRYTTDWIQVPEKYYKMNEPFLGMSVYTKKEGEEITTATPPGYAYVGDSRYGHWRQDRNGGSFWEFYGKYALISHLMGGWYRPVYRTDYDAFRNNRSRNRPFLGRNREFGSTGTVVQKQKPNFYARHMAKQRAAMTNFKQSVNRRIGRTRSGFRSRSVGFGK